MDEDQLFCVGQKELIEKDGEVLILNEPILGIDLPGGKIQVGEVDFIEALKREVMEETGLTITVGKPFCTGYFDVPTGLALRNEGKKIFLIFYKVKYKSGEVKLSEEHDTFQWVNKDDIKRLKFTSYGNIEKALRIYFKI